MAFDEAVFKLNVGVDRYNPDIAEGTSIQFKRLKNVQPGNNRLRCPSGNTLLQAITAVTSVIRSFAYYTIPTSQFTSLYAFSNTSAYRFQFSSQLFNITPIYTGFPDVGEPFAKVSWLDANYVTKRLGKLVKFQLSVATEIADAPGGRYAVIADSHLMLGNTTNGVDPHPVRLQWSDLYAPESWAVGPASEADFFELSPDDGEITGLSYQRGATLIYTFDRIWVGRYLKGSDGSPGKFQFDILFSGLGNVYHYAQIRVKEVDYFIGEDNFYKLDGFQLSEIGDSIWEFFQETIIKDVYQDQVIAIRLPDKYEIAWIYNHVDGYMWSVVYNYKENKWSDRDPQDIFCNINLPFPVRGYLAWEDATFAWNDATPRTWDGDWQYFDTSIRYLFGGSAGQVYVPDAVPTYVKADGDPFECEVETFELDCDTLFTEKEFDRLKLLFSKLSGSVNADSDLKLYIGHRVSRDAGVTWTDPVNMIDMLANEPTFFFRNKGVGKLVRFKFVWTNHATYAITELVKMCFFKLNTDGNQATEK